MQQKIDKFGNFTVSLFDIDNQQDSDRFIYYYLSLDKPILSNIEIIKKILLTDVYEDENE